MQRAALLVTILAAIGVSRADPKPSDGDFRTAVSTYATKTKRKLVSWGTLHLDAARRIDRQARRATAREVIAACWWLTGDVSDR